MPIPIEITTSSPPITPPPTELWIHASKTHRQAALDLLNTKIPPNITRIILSTPNIPTFDDMLAASFAQWQAQGESLPEAAATFARYAALARSGYSPSRIPLEFAPENIFQALSWPHAQSFPESTTQFLADYHRMAAILHQAILNNQDPFTTQLFSEANGFPQEIINLRNDRKLYEQDLKTAFKYRIHLNHTDNSALLLENPKSLLFKQWARADKNSPTADGYLLLAVYHPNLNAGNQWIFSTDPLLHLNLKPLADLLTALEQSHNHPNPWFDGQPFNHTLIAAPNTGTKLPPALIIHTFQSWSHATRISQRATNHEPPSTKKKLLTVAAFLLISLTCWLAYHTLISRGTFDPSESATELDQLHIQTLKSRSPIFNQPNLALFVGINEFRPNEFPQLTFAVDDAISQCHLFVIELDLIPPQNAILALEGTPGTRRAAKQLTELQALGIQPTHASRSDILAGLLKLRDLSLLIQPNGTTAPDRLLIVSLSTHGFEYQNIAYIIPHDALLSSLADTAIPVPTLTSLMSQSNANKRLLLIDACRESPFANSKAAPQQMSQSFIEALTAAKGHALLASCSPGQSSYETSTKGHGLFTYWLILALKGAAPADQNGFITLHTLQTYLSEKVANDSLHNAPALQQPYFSLSDSAAQIPLAIPSTP